MARMFFFLLLIGNVALGAHIYLSETRPPAALPAEINGAMLKIVSIADAGKAQQEAMAARRLAASLRGSACVDFGVKPADGPRAQLTFAAMNLGERLSNRNAEEFTRFAVSIPPLKDKRAADALVASLKKTGIKDVSVLGDSSVSLGIFSSDDAARKAAAEIQAKGGALVKDLQVVPRNPQIRETVFTVREPDVNMIARLTLLQRDFEASTLKAVTCPVAAGAPVAAVVAPDTKAANEKTKP